MCIPDKFYFVAFLLEHEGEKQTHLCWTTNWTVRLMTDDCNQLQKDLNKLVNWASEMQMKFNAFKCYELRITNRKKHVLHNYIMHNQIWENLDQNPYLGFQFTNTLKWDTHINNS